MSKRVGFLGLGLMGARMAANLLKRGHALTVWNRNPDRAQPLVKAGAKLGSTPREVAEQSDVVVCCVSDPNAVGRVMFAEDGIRPAARSGFRYVECSTISPGLARRTAESLRAAGADALEAPVTGSKMGAEQGTLIFMTGGRRETHDELEPLLMDMGSRAIYCGETGAASTVKLIGNSVITFMLQGLCEGLVAARKAGIAPEKLLEVVQASGYASPYYNFKGGAIQRRDWDTHFSIDLMHKDQTLMLEEASRLQVPMPGLAALREVFQAARANGWGGEDIAAVYKVLERQAGLS